MILNGVVSSLISLVINAFVYQKELGYRIRDQISDIAGIVIISAIMGIATYFLSFTGLNYFYTLVLQVTFGIAVYILLSILLKIDSFYYLLDLIKNIMAKK